MEYITAYIWFDAGNRPNNEGTFFVMLQWFSPNFLLGWIFRLLLWTLVLSVGQRSGMAELNLKLNQSLTSCCYLLNMTPYSRKGIKRQHFSHQKNFAKIKLLTLRHGECYLHCCRIIYSGLHDKICHLPCCLFLLYNIAYISTRYVYTFSCEICKRMDMLCN